ncbi:MAG: acyl carrier protein [Dorea sp.]|jgi:acyl carrier protein|nr:acyl carrier protein [Clostridiales bacterium]MCI9271490.1 acyl carrier protein [Dorea sp.]
MITIENSISGIQKKILEVIASNIDEIFSGELSLDMDFANIGLDSLTFIKLVINLESEFDFEFDDEMLLITVFPKLETMVEYVESKIACKERNI